MLTVGTTTATSPYRKDAAYCIAGDSTRRPRGLGLLLVAILCAANLSFGLDRTKDIDQYGHENWNSQDGLPGEAVYQILQSLDGYLWIRTSAGLVRFDGVRFVLVEPRVGGRTLDEPIKAISLNPKGDLLVRSTGRSGK